MVNSSSKSAPSVSYENIVRELVLSRLRIVGIVGTLLILLFSKLDALVYPQLWRQFLAIRMVMGSLFLACVGFSFHPQGRKHFLILTDFLIYTAAFGISLFIYFSDGSGSDYYQGLNLTFLGMFAINSFRPKHHAGTGILILLTYIGMALTSKAPFNAGKFASGLFFMGSTLFFVTLSAKFYGQQHQDQFFKNEEIKIKNQKLDEAYRKLRENEKLKDEFFANVSHELRTPLTLIFAPLESLLADSAQKWDAAARTHLEILRRNTSRLLQIMNGLLDFSKLEAGKMEVQRQPLEIVSAARIIIEDFQPAVRQKRISLSFQPAVSEAWIEMDHYFFDRIFFNLLSNAVKFTDKGEIKVRLDLQNSKMILTVEDSGIGIPQDQIPHLFEKFRQVEGSSTRRFEGTGLGLAMVKEFVTLLNGHIEVTSTPEKGTTFRVTCEALPAIRKTERFITSPYSRAEPLLEIPEALKSISQKISPGKPAKILIAEDNPELASYIASLLQPFSEIQFAENGNKALQTAAAWLPDIILSDIMMPLKDGIALCREVKASENLRHIPVILLTALTHREALLKGWEAGADEYLFKPFHPTELVTRIKSILNSLELRRSIEEKLMQQTAESTRLRTELEHLELFSFVASHDLQEPLHALLMLTSILRQSQKENWSPSQEEYLNTIQESVRQMQQYLQDILKYAQSGNIETFRLVDLNAVFAKVVKDLQQTIWEYHVKIEAEPLPVIESDFAQMEQIFKNLIGNAIKFRHPDHPPEIKIRYQSDEEHHLLFFHDNGLGFDEKYASQIFKPFYRLHKHKIKGSGLGLAICQKIVQRHGGKIEVRSKVNFGTTFTVFLPKKTGPHPASSVNFKNISDSSIL